MKRKIAVSAAVAVLAGAGLYFAGRKVASVPPPGAEAGASAADAAAPAAASEATLSGTVAKVDASSRSLSLEGEDGKTAVYALAPDALVTRGRSNRKADVAALKAGQKVTVSLKNALVANVHIDANSSRKARLRKAASKAS